MNDGRASEAGGPGDITHCEWCGAEFDTPLGSSAAALRPRRAARPLTPPAPGEGETHCEWCGAEYPVPGAVTEPRRRPQLSS